MQSLQLFCAGGGGGVVVQFVQSEFIFTGNADDADIRRVRKKEARRRHRVEEGAIILKILFS